MGFRHLNGIVYVFYISRQYRNGDDFIIFYCYLKYVPEGRSIVNDNPDNQ